MIKEFIEKAEEEERVATEEDEELVQVLRELKPNIKVVGIGGAGCNTIHRMFMEGVSTVELIAANTDAQHLLTIRAHRKILLGRRTTRGLGAGAKPHLGEEATKEAVEDFKRALRGAHMVFVTCGLGGGTGTGGAPVVSQIAKQEGALTIAVCTLPFRAEGWHRYQNAKAGLDRLRRVADTVITIPNDKLIELVPKLPLNQAFRFADEILMRAILGITDLILKPGLVNLDFNDLKTIMAGGGVSMIGMGEASGEDRVVKALENAINSPLLEVDLSTATGLLVNVIGGPGMTMKEAEKAVEELHRYVPEDANIIWGIAIDPEMGDKVRVMVVAANVTSPYILGKTTEEELRELGLDIIR